VSGMAFLIYFGTAEIYTTNRQISKPQQQFLQSQSIHPAHLADGEFQCLIDRTTTLL